MGQYCFARWRPSSVVVCNAAGRPAAGRVGGRAADTASVVSIDDHTIIDFLLRTHFITHCMGLLFHIYNYSLYRFLQKPFVSDSSDFVIIQLSMAVNGLRHVLICR